MLVNKQSEYFYKFLADMFSRIEKINDNGRMVMHIEIKELGKVSGVQPSSDG